MEKFTKGEWSVKDSDVVVGDTTIATTYNPSNLDLSFYTFDNNVVGSNFEFGLLAKEANAHLISAAPDMYRALRGVADKLPFTPNQFGGGYSITLTQAEVDAIRAALAKADGEQQ